jgi:hypothetical protein
MTLNISILYPWNNLTRKKLSILSFISWYIRFYHVSFLRPTCYGPKAIRNLDRSVSETIKPDCPCRAKFDTGKYDFKGSSLLGKWNILDTFNQTTDSWPQFETRKSCHLVLFANFVDLWIISCFRYCLYCCMFVYCIEMWICWTMTSFSPHTELGPN